MSLPQRPMTYTTVNTTTHTTSTKCQYSESTSMRAACSIPTRPAIPNSEDDAEHDQADGDVEGVQADQRVVGRAEQVRGDRQPVLVDQPVPFLASAVQEQTAEHDRQRPQRQERAVARRVEDASRQGGWSGCSRAGRRCRRSAPRARRAASVRSGSCRDRRDRRRRRW